MPSPPGYTDGDWQAIVAWLTDAEGAGQAATGIVSGMAAAEEYAVRRAAELIGMHWDAEAAEWVESVMQDYRLEAYVRQELESIIAEGIKRGYGYGELRVAVEDYLGNEVQGRALMIARTETGLAYNEGATAGYQAQGVANVIVHDGDDAGACEECAALDGQVWTVEEAAANPLGHPNCVRAFEPLIEEEQG